MQDETVVRFEARKIRDGFVRESDNKPQPALWAVVEAVSGVRLKYGESEKVCAAVNRWNAKPERVPEKIRDKVEAARQLKELLKPGDRVQTILRHVSRSGMMRHISVVFESRDITWLVARVLEDKIADDGGIKCGGCGMDMGFNLVYNLGRALWPWGFVCSGEACVSNDHFNSPREFKRETFKGKMHMGDGGYALKQEWL